jgi:catechol 2,3-dioxygenase-like lactoylglutathione lyase family enzyme
VTERMKLTSAVIFVRDLDRSKEFYGQLLQLDVAMTTAEALLLYAGEGDHVVLPRGPGKAWTGLPTRVFSY